MAPIQRPSLPNPLARQPVTVISDRLDYADWLSLGALNGPLVFSTVGLWQSTAARTPADLTLRPEA